MNKNITEEDKRHLVDLVKQGKTVAEVCQSASVSRSALYHWISIYSPHKRIASKGEINLKELYKLERRLATLEEENAIFRKSGCGTKSTNEEKIAAVKALKGVFTEYALCRTLGLSKATYYRSQNKTETWFDKKNEELRPAIKRVFEESREHPLLPESQTFYSRTNIWTRRQRPFSRLGNLTPDQFEIKYRMDNLKVKPQTEPCVHGNVSQS